MLPFGVGTPPWADLAHVFDRPLAEWAPTARRPKMRRSTDGALAVKALPDSLFLACRPSQCRTGNATLLHDRVPAHTKHLLVGERDIAPLRIAGQVEPNPPSDIPHHPVGWAHRCFRDASGPHAASIPVPSRPFKAKYEQDRRVCRSNRARNARACSANRNRFRFVGNCLDHQAIGFRSTQVDRYFDQPSGPPLKW